MSQTIENLILGEDVEKYNDLVQGIGDEQFVAFVGAGMSKCLGYPTWKQLIERMAETAGHQITLPRHPSAEDLYGAAGECFDRMGEDKYYRFVRETFWPKPEMPFSNVHRQLLAIPFLGYLTTNFEISLLKACEEPYPETPKIGKCQSYPLLDAAYVRERSLFYLHGRVCDHREAPCENTTVLTKQQVLKAYRYDEQLYTFLHQVMSNKRVLFIGCGLNDPGILIIMQLATDFKARAARRLCIPAACDAPHFALVAAGRTARHRDRDQWLARSQLKPIRYHLQSPDIVHAKLYELVARLLNDTNPVALAAVPPTHYGPFDVRMRRNGTTI